MTTVTALIPPATRRFPETYLPGKTIEASFIQELLKMPTTHPRTSAPNPGDSRYFTPKKAARRWAICCPVSSKNTPAELFSEEKMMKAGENPLKAGAVIAIIMQRDPAEGVPSGRKSPP
jgi:hypothetical protein